MRNTQHRQILPQLVPDEDVPFQQLSGSGLCGCERDGVWRNNKKPGRTNELGRELQVREGSARRCAKTKTSGGNALRQPPENAEQKSWYALSKEFASKPVVDER